MSWQWQSVKPWFDFQYESHVHSSVEVCNSERAPLNLSQWSLVMCTKDKRTVVQMIWYIWASEAASHGWSRRLLFSRGSLCICRQYESNNNQCDAVGFPMFSMGKHKSVHVWMNVVYGHKVMYFSSCNAYWCLYINKHKAHPEANFFTPQTDAETGSVWFEML